jgi:hypothetical protein
MVHVPDKSPVRFGVAVGPGVAEEDVDVGGERESTSEQASDWVLEQPPTRGLTRVRRGELVEKGTLPSLQFLVMLYMRVLRVLLCGMGELEGNGDEMKAQ